MKVHHHNGVVNDARRASGFGKTRRSVRVRWKDHRVLRCRWSWFSLAIFGLRAGMGDAKLINSLLSILSWMMCVCVCGFFRIFLFGVSALWLFILFWISVCAICALFSSRQLCFVVKFVRFLNCILGSFFFIGKNARRYFREIYLRK